MVVDLARNATIKKKIGKKNFVQKLSRQKKKRKNCHEQSERIFFLQNFSENPPFHKILGTPLAER